MSHGRIIGCRRRWRIDASENADHIKALAERLQKTVTVLKQEAAATRTQRKRAYAASLAAIALSVIATVIAIAALVR